MATRSLTDDTNTPPHLLNKVAFKKVVPSLEDPVLTLASLSFFFVLFFFPALDFICFFFFFAVT